MLVFREGRRTQSGDALLRPLLHTLRQSVEHPGLILEALLRSGELECGLADLASPHSSTVSAATDVLAEMLLGMPPRVPVSEMVNRLARIPMPQQITVSSAEGFAYYALHPLQYAELVNSLPLTSGNAAVVGIRSIGTTLSAVVAAACRRRGITAERISVRPTGHPFDRITRLGFTERRWVAAQRARSAEFLVVDEGPGLSGSSFLSVGDALLEQGVPRSSLAFLCAAQPDPARLCARDAARRWREFRTYAVAARPAPAMPKAVDVSGGMWRRHLLDIACNWPASWVTMERAKFISHDGQHLFKFEGLGHFGAAVAQRARALADAGFAPACEDAGDGYLAYIKHRGLPASRMDLCRPLLDRMAEYCAFRAAEFRAPAGGHDDLSPMAAWNLHEEFGVPNQPRPADFETKIPVVADGRMQPHEWLLTAAGVLKSDGVGHGDDHFYPGPTDIAWDLAGAIVEWDLGRDLMAYFLHRYAALSGDQVQLRIPAWLQAYTAFRMGYCKMAAESLRGSEEEERLLRDYRRYRARAQAVFAQPIAA